MDDSGPYAMRTGLRGIFGTRVVEQQKEHKWVVARIDVRRENDPGPSYSYSAR